MVCCGTLGLSAVCIGLWLRCPAIASKEKQINLNFKQVQTAGSNIVFDINQIDIGEHFADSGPFLARFPFQNIGDSSVDLTVKSCCGARSIFEDEKTMYKAGEKGELLLEFFPKSAEEGLVSRTATVFQKEAAVPISELEAIVTIKRHWRVKPYPIIKFSRVDPGEIVDTELVIEAGTFEEEGEISSFEISSSLLEVKEIDQTRFNRDNKRYKYQVSLTGADISGYFDTNIIFETTNSEVPEIVVPVKAEFPGIITAQPRSLYFGRIFSGSVVNRSLRIVSNTGEPVKITKTLFEKEYITLEKIHPAENTKEVNLNFIANIPVDGNGILRGNIRVMGRTSREFEIEIPWLAIVLSKDSV
jgi:hypothetical protein